MIKPGLRSYDGRYTELYLEWAGVKADVRTATEGEDLVVLYSPHSGSSADKILFLEPAMLWNRPGTLERRADTIVAQAGTRSHLIRASESSTGLNLPLSSPHLTFRSDREVAFFTGRSRSVADVKTLLATRRSEIESESKRFGRLAEAHQAMRNATAWNLFFDAENDRAVASVSRTWNEAWGGFILFEWDTFFAAWMMAVDDKRLAYGNILAITNSLTEEGFVPNVAAAHDTKSRDRSQPPVGALTVKTLFNKFHDRWLVAAVYGPLLRWNRWWNDHRQNQGYLSWGSDPHPRGMDGGTKQAAMFESGLDNSPLFDDAVFDPGTHMLALASVDLMSLYIVDCEALAELAEVLGNQADAVELRTRGRRYAMKLQELWDDTTGIYRDKDLQTGKFSSRLAPTNFYPLLAQVPSQAQAERMVSEHLLNPEEFFGTWMMPSISRSDPAFADNTYWRGRIWAPMNLLVYLGLRNYNLPQAQSLLASRSEQLLLKEWREHQHVHENYNAETGDGDDVANSDSFYSWGGLLGLIGLIEGGYF